jgi:hypothetical protein
MPHKRPKCNHRAPASKAQKRRHRNKTKTSRRLKSVTDADIKEGQKAEGLPKRQPFDKNAVYAETAD